MASFFEIDIFDNDKKERELITMLVTQDSWSQGMNKLLERYKEKTQEKLGKLGNDHDTDLMCKVIINTIDFIQTIPYSMTEGLKQLKRKKEV